MIRRAEIKDWDAACKLFLNEASNPCFIVFDKDKFMTQLKKELQNSKKYYYVLESDANNQIIGFIKTEPKYMGPRRRLYISSVIIDKREQGKGYGKALMKDIEKKAKEQGFDEITLDVSTENERAVKFYEKLGFETAKYLMRKNL
ncbi:GNAT family N-acetyltransferase [Candidatus Micrarchaeota archaeon]|jgi:ribosomal protein S18 acetylase RimI-like enzyme|nr:GNAT family N-acetyltransferase [Candidatus Micrarchaeota archaeon]